MAVAYIQEFPIADRSTANYDYVADKIGDGPFDGLIAHSAGFDDDAGVFRILDIWETREQAERFLAEQGTFSRFVELPGNGAVNAVFDDP